MSLSPAAVSPQRARDTAGPWVLIAGGRLARLTTLLTLRALMAEGLEITMPAPARKFIKPSISAAQPFDPQRVALRLADTASALGAWCDRRMLDRHDTRGTARPGDPWANPPRT